MFLFSLITASNVLGRHRSVICVLGALLRGPPKFFTNRE